MDGDSPQPLKTGRCGVDNIENRLSVRPNSRPPGLGAGAARVGNLPEHLASNAAHPTTIYSFPPSFSGNGSPSGINVIEIELTQCRVFFSVNRSPRKTCPK